MKYLSIILLAIFGLSLNASAQEDAISKYFNQYVEDENFSVVYISAKMFEMLGKLDIDELEDKETEVIFEVVKDMRGLRVLTTEHNAMKMYNEAVKTINTKGYDQLMTVRTEDEKVQFLVKEDADVISELLLLVGEEDEFVMVSFIGNIHLNKISKLAKVLDVQGAEHLEKLEEEGAKEKKKL
ncbi:MAG: vacuolar-type H+-ATPase subunit F/Vma7 [Polaribacter sp.]|jgi:vacuolar-type H+-ATPase subunit F/Vma7